MAADRDDIEAQRLLDQGHPVGKPIGRDELSGCRAIAAEISGTGSALARGEIRVSSQIVAKRNAYSADGPDFLNSFIADDLHGVAGQVRSGKIGAALRAYLRPEAEIDQGQRIDVRERLDTVLAATAPREVPLGRWPSRPDHPLALGQQLAVNSALRMLGTDGGVLGVNGPPGTGKTTMLRDLIAALIVERARRLAELNDPRDAFIGQQRWKTGRYNRVVHVWNPRLTGFEMVVASANNGAVENVTKEIPARDAIDEAWRDEATRLDHFPGIASALLSDGKAGEVDPDDRRGAGRNGTAPPDTAWALVAARLGKKANRARFLDAFWYRRPPAPAAEVVEARQPGTATPAGEQAHRGLLAILQEYEQSSPTGSWPAAVAEFRQAVDRAATLQADRDGAYQALVRHGQAEHELRAAQEAATDARQRAAAVLDQIAEGERVMQAWQAERQRRLGARTEHHQFRPGFLEWLTSLGRAMRPWRARDQDLAAEVDAADQTLASAHRELSRLAREADLAGQDASRRDEAARWAERSLQEIRLLLGRARNALGAQFPDEDWWQDRPRRELAALWTDPEWNAARTRLFLAALRLHKTFVRHAAKEMRQSLQGAADLLSGEAPHDLPADAALAAWQALFFVVPVVSTTFASFARLFSHLRQDALGWLLVDEAGQATPQNAVGALWRSKRAMIVGDPLQLEPITTLPFRAEQAIRGSHHVAEEWLTSRTSAQQLADKTTRFGTWLPGADRKIWVGAPLTVHRRCDQPMFGIANDIAYGGLMINGTGRGRSEEFNRSHLSLPESKWIDIVSGESQGHWIPAEGEQLKRILAALAGRDFDMSRVMVIAPFQDVARRVRRQTAAYRGLTAGTIHTAQGKEADIVILVLGGDPQREGARRWAAARPNLLNVAVSRARRRLYVIGDRSGWAGQRHFDVLAERLPHSGPR
jgi:hypothetical protein